MAKEYTKEQLNYFRICYVTTDVLADGLREIFKKEWDKLYKSTKGEWRDDPRNGFDFYIGESPRNQRKNAHLLATMRNGNREEWDCTMLFYAILYSDCVGPSLASTVRKSVDDLRNFRNKEFAHIPQGRLSDMDFKNAISKVDVAFHALGLPTVKIQEIQNQATFPTKHLLNILKEVDNVKKDLQEKEDQRQVLTDQLRKEVPSFCILPPKPAHDIGSRDREVAKIAQQLKQLKMANCNRLSYSYISGNPGSGKSQLAGLVAQRFYDEVKEMASSSSFVMTINAASLDSLLESYANFARQLKCPDYSVMQTLSYKEWSIGDKISHLKMLIEAKISHYTSWLMIVDNVTTLSSVRVHLPQSGNEAWARGQLLITTQDTTSIPLESSLVNHVSVSKGMEPDDASCLLAKLSGITDGELGAGVAQKLDYQPLALAGAAVFVKNIRQDKASMHFGWKEYLKLLEKGKRQVTEHTLAGKNSAAYPNTMTKAITLAVETQVKSDKFVKDLFSLLSLCTPQPLNVDVAIDYIAKANENFDKEDKELIRMTLSSCSLLLLEEQKNGSFIRVHKVVHDSIKSVMSGYQNSQKSKIVSQAVDSLNQFIVETQLGENRRLETMNVIPHITSLITVIDQLFSRESIFQVEGMSAQKFKNLGEICRLHCEFIVGKKYLEHSVAIQLRLLGVNHVDVAASYTALSSIYKDLGDLEKAKGYQQHALDIELEKLGGENVTVASSYSKLAVIFMELGDLEQAEDYQQRALAIELEKLGTEHVTIATSYNNLALIHKQLGNLKQAKEYQQQALSIQLKKLGAGHVSAATSYCNLASIHKDLGDLDKAKKYQQRTLDIESEKLGANHVSVAKSYTILASICKHLGDLEQSKVYQQRALVIQVKRLGTEHVSVATSYSNLGSIYKDLGDLKQAYDYQQSALAIKLQKLGAEHVSVATSYSNLALVHKELGDLRLAREYQQRALSIQDKRLGSHHVSVATSYNNFALIYKDLGDLKTAMMYQKRALAIKLKKLGAEHSSVATSYGNLALIHMDLGDLGQAKEYQKRALRIELKQLGAEHISVALSFNNFSVIHHRLHDLTRGKKYQQRALEIKLKKLGPEHVSVATSYSNLSSIYKDLRDLEQAKEYQQRALAIKLKKLGGEHDSVATSYSHLATIHQWLGDFEQFKKYQLLALGIKLKKVARL